MIELNFTFWVFLASFVVFIAGMKLIFFDPLHSLVNARETFIQDLVRSSAALRQSIEEQLQDNTSKSIIEEAKKNAQLIFAKANLEANQIRDQKISCALLKIKENFKNTVHDFEQEASNVLLEAPQIAQELSDLALQKIELEVKKVVSI